MQISENSGSGLHCISAVPPLHLWHTVDMPKCISKPARPEIGIEPRKVIIDTHGITDEQRGSAKFKLAYQDMLTQLTAPGFAHVLCCHEAAHLFYFMAAGTKNYETFPARLRYDPAIGDYSGSMASVQILDMTAPTEGKVDEWLSRVARAHAAGGVVARKLMSSTGGPWSDPTGGDQDDKERLAKICQKFNAANISIDAENFWKWAQDSVLQELSEHPDLLPAIEQLAAELRPKLGL